jgi:uncharacterized membrane protein HdeD (DUF308 family)
MSSLVTAPPLLGADDGSKRVGTRSRAKFIAAAAVGILVLGAAAALSPALDHVSGTTVLGLLLVAAGFFETMAGRLRHETRGLAMLAGLVTIFAGALLILNRGSGVLPNATIVTAWLLVRAIILLVTSRLAHGSVRKFLGLSAATDLVLGVGLLVGLSVATLAVTIFGPSPELLASYGFVLALSFAATGALLLEVASCERGRVSPLSVS